MKICQRPGCGVENPDTAKFCRSCGYQFKNKQGIAKWLITTIISVAVSAGIASYFAYPYFHKQEVKTTSADSIQQILPVEELFSNSSPKEKKVQPPDVKKDRQPSLPEKADSDKSKAQETPDKNDIRVSPEPQNNEPEYVVKAYANGNIYAGYVDNRGRKQGKGTYTWASGNKYEGNYIDDEMNGFGTYYSTEGWKFEGNFKNGKFHGNGTYYFPDGKKRKGVWENGEFKSERP
jgi:hypothetical protein